MREELHGPARCARGRDGEHHARRVGADVYRAPIQLGDGDVPADFLGRRISRFQIGCSPRRMKSTRAWKASQGGRTRLRIKSCSPPSASGGVLVPLPPGYQLKKIEQRAGLALDTFVQRSETISVVAEENGVSRDTVERAQVLRKDASVLAVLAQAQNHAPYGSVLPCGDSTGRYPGSPRRIWTASK
jgi:hypothetical protein